MHSKASTQPQGSFAVDLWQKFCFESIQSCSASLVNEPVWTMLRQSSLAGILSGGKSRFSYGDLATGYPKQTIYSARVPLHSEAWSMGTIIRIIPKLITRYDPDVIPDCPFEDRWSLPTEIVIGNKRIQWSLLFVALDCLCTYIDACNEKQTRLIGGDALTYLERRLASRVLCVLLSTSTAAWSLQQDSLRRRILEAREVQIKRRSVLSVLINMTVPPGTRSSLHSRGLFCLDPTILLETALTSTFRLWFERFVTSLQFLKQQLWTVEVHQWTKHCVSRFSQPRTSNGQNPHQFTSSHQRNQSQIPDTGYMESSLVMHYLGHCPAWRKSALICLSRGWRAWPPDWSLFGRKKGFLLSHGPMLIKVRQMRQGCFPKKEKRINALEQSAFKRYKISFWVSAVIKVWNFKQGHQSLRSLWSCSEFINELLWSWSLSEFLYFGFQRNWMWTTTVQRRHSTFWLFVQFYLQHDSFLSDVSHSDCAWEHIRVKLTTARQFSGKVSESLCQMKWEMENLILVSGESLFLVKIIQSRAAAALWSQQHSSPHASEKLSVFSCTSRARKAKTNAEFLVLSFARTGNNVESKAHSVAMQPHSGASYTPSWFNTPNTESYLLWSGWFG